MTGSLFDGLPTSSGNERSRRPRSVAKAACSMCSSESVGLIRSPDGQHLTWRMHNLTTFYGTRLPCQASGQHLCTVPPRALAGVDSPQCPHERNSYMQLRHHDSEETP